MKKSIISCLFMIVISSPLWAQHQAHDYMRQTGKINVVFGVILIIFLGIVWYLIRLERKINHLEKKINHE